MPLLQPDPRSARIGLGVHAVMIAAIVLGLLGMHVLASEGPHAGHGPSMAVMSAEPDTVTHHGHDGAMTEKVGTPAGTTVPGVWAVICVLALLLTVVLVAPLGSSWRLGRRDASWRAAALGAPDDAPRHPPSLALLSISRT